MLRRKKDDVHDGKPLLNLPPKTIEVIRCKFEPDERDFYDSIERQTALSFDTVSSSVLQTHQNGEHPYRHSVICLSIG